MVECGLIPLLLSGAAVGAQDPMRCAQCLNLMARMPQHMQAVVNHFKIFYFSLLSLMCFSSKQILFGKKKNNNVFFSQKIDAGVVDLLKTTLQIPETRILRASLALVESLVKKKKKTFFLNFKFSFFFEKQ